MTEARRLCHGNSHSLRLWGTVKLHTRTIELFLSLTIAYSPWRNEAKPGPALALLSFACRSRLRANISCSPVFFFGLGFDFALGVSSTREVEITFEGVFVGFDVEDIGGACTISVVVETRTVLVGTSSGGSVALIPATARSEAPFRFATLGYICALSCSIRRSFSLPHALQVRRTTRVMAPASGILDVFLLLPARTIRTVLVPSSRYMPHAAQWVASN